ncbi:glycosyltransferase family 2 protein [Mucilaginibacter galii]|uniref:Glycosyl transferase family A n=1 Tax=Mucilaginibacter galii TaxID=2005073 RepID=A0A917J813_9SPHI|nr:galactosyltransferase-related protein [Mucilaginibacter galii]GGI50753.1 glycosyl transferase family A [Mucilaginibacter galii]
MTGISVITIVKDRKEALDNTLAGLMFNSVLPAEVIIVHMNENLYELKAMPFPIHAVKLNSPVSMPLAAARNYGVRHAKYEKIVFLDVDCIPSPTLLDDYDVNWDMGALLSGHVRYLSKHAVTQPLTPANLDQHSMPDPIRGNLSSISYELFWSLNFACSKSVFNKIGGFDENFEGYGGEDTDFAFAARNKGIKITSVNATAYHQYHASYAPPINHLVDIVDNAQRFYGKWQCWPMEGWLVRFRDLGLIQWDRISIRVLRTPSTNETQQYLKV